MKLKNIISKLSNWNQKDQSDMSNEPIVILDTANLLAGEYTNFKEAKKIIDKYLPLIDRCAIKTWGILPKQKYAFSLSSIKPEIHQYLETFAYQLEVVSPFMTQTMKMEKASKLDDYALNRRVKSLVTQEGERDFLIVSGDRDFEALAHQMSSYGTKFFYVQRQKQKHQDNMHFTRYSMLREFAHTLTQSEEKLLLAARSQESITAKSSSQNHTKSELLSRQILDGQSSYSTPTQTHFSVLHHQAPIKTVKLFDNFKIGRSSERIGPVDLCLAEFDEHKQYSRKLAKIFKLGSSWVIWRPPVTADKQDKQVITISKAKQEHTLESGESVILANSDQIHFGLCDLILEFHD